MLSGPFCGCNIAVTPLFLVSIACVIPLMAEAALSMVRFSSIACGLASRFQAPVNLGHLLMRCWLCSADWKLLRLLYLLSPIFSEHD